MCFLSVTPLLATVISPIDSLPPKMKIVVLLLSIPIYLYGLFISIFKRS